MKTNNLLVCLLVVALAVACGGSGSKPSPSLAQSPSVTQGPASLAVRIVVPEYSLQFMNFWIALGAGYFQEEGVNIQLVTPPNPMQAGQFLLQGQADVALLPPPLYLNLIGQQQPILLFANLLQNDPINVVVRKDVAQQRNLSPTQPLAQRLEGLRGLKIGVAPNPPTRLNVLLASAGLSPDRDVQIVIMPPEQENQAFGSGQVDALYAHSPYLEKALVEQEGVLLINQSKGEITQLPTREIHSLVTTRQFASSNPQALLAITRAIFRAEKLVHSDKRAAIDALFASGIPGLQRPLVEAIVAIYEPAIPQTPEVSTQGIEGAVSFFPFTQTPPDFSKINLADYVATQFARDATSGKTSP